MMLVIVVLLLVLCVNGESGPMRAFIKAMDAGELDAARMLVAEMEILLRHQQSHRMMVPAGQKLQWQIRNDRERLMQIRQMCGVYIREVNHLLGGFFNGAKSVQNFFTNKLVALYHMRELIHRSRILTAKEKTDFIAQIDSVGVMDSPLVEELRKKLSIVYASSKIK
jgi:hypothetical protein